MEFVLAPKPRKEKIDEFLETEIGSLEDLKNALNELNSSEKLILTKALKEKNESNS